MCIRDRRHAGRADWSDRGGGDHSVMGAAAGHVGAVGRIACLLYTSDAADDLLCVDLGGRRIIKKKNITQAVDNLIATCYIH